jgi:hypothetical protein
MQHTIRWAVLAMLLSMLAACTTPTEQPAAQRATKKRNGPVLQDQVQALDKAKALSQEIQAAEKARQHIIAGESQ